MKSMNRDKNLSGTLVFLTLGFILFSASVYCLLHFLLFFLYIVMRKVMYKYGFLFFLCSFLVAQDLTPEEILTYVASHPKPESSITEIRLEITRKKKRKKRSKFENLRDMKNYIISGKFTSKSLARFHKPKIVKGTSFLSWVYKNGKTDQWFALPNNKKSKESKSKRQVKIFFEYRFYL